MKNLKHNFLMLTMLAAPLALTGCAIAVVGAIGAAGVSAVDKGVASEKTPVVEVRTSEIEVQPKAVTPENVVQRQALKSIQLEPVDSLDVQQLAAQPSQVIDLDTVNVDALKNDSAVSTPPSDVSISAPAATHTLINNTSFEHLVAHPWKVVGMRGVIDFAFDVDKSVFVFSKHGEFKALISCNYISGKFAADDAGKFSLNKLNSSHNSCTSSRDQEVVIVSMLLSADQFFINDRTLILVAQGKSILALMPTEKNLNLADVKKSLQVPTTHSKPNHTKPKAIREKSKISTKNKK